MKMFIVLAALIAASLAATAPLTFDKQTTLLRTETDVREDGYNFGFETSDGTSRQETGELKNAGTDEAAIAVSGSVTWTAPNGEKFTLRYVADEKGYQPEGEHLPK